MVSVIIPVYNVVNYIDKCMESVINQTFRDIEIILINDGSTDGSDKKCEIWSQLDDRIIYISKKNQGPGISRNIGVNVAQYPYVTFLDADDWWDLTYIEKMYTAAILSKADIVLCDINYIEQLPNGEYQIVTSRLRMPEGKILIPSENINVINTARAFLCGKLFRKNLFTNYRIEQPSHYYEDLAVTPIIVALSKSLYRIPIPLYNYFRNRNGSTMNSSLHLGDMVLTLRGLKQRFEQHDLYNHYYEAFKKLSYNHVRVILNKINQQKSSNNLSDEHRKIKKELFDFMDENFVGWIKFDDKSFSMMGSPYLKKVISNITFVQTSFVQIIGKQRLNEIKSSDYLIIDLSDELINILLKQNLEEQADSLYHLFAKMLNKINPEKVFVVSNKLEDITEKRREHEELQASIIEKLFNEYSNMILLNVEKEYQVEDEESLSWEIADRIFYELSRKDKHSE